MARSTSNPKSSKKLCFTSTNKELLAQTLLELSGLSGCHFVKMSVEPKDGMYLGRCFFTNDSDVGKYWAKYGRSKYLMCNIQDDDFARQYREPSATAESAITDARSQVTPDLGNSAETQIVYPSEKYFSGFYATLSAVAKERVYIEMIEAPPLESVISFQKEHISKNGPVYYAVSNDQVIGWRDVFPMSNPRQVHRGALGMGLLPEYRGQGIGARLLTATLAHAKRFGLEKVELHVYTSNTPAIALYKKFGFEQEGLIQKYRKLDGQYFDVLAMGKFL